MKPGSRVFQITEIVVDFKKTRRRDPSPVVTDAEALERISSRSFLSHKHVPYKEGTMIPLLSEGAELESSCELLPVHIRGYHDAL